METIQLLPILHRAAEQILVHHATNGGFEQLTRRIRGAKWSSSHKGWYLPLTQENVQTIQQVFKEIALVETTALRDYLYKRQAVRAAIVPPSIEAPKPEKPLMAIAKKLPLKTQSPTPHPTAVCNLTPSNEAALGKMLDHLKLKAYSSSTMRTYRGEMLVFMQVLGNHPAERLTTEDVKRYVLSCINEGLSENTIHSRINALKFFYEQVLGREKFFVEIPRPKKPLQLPKVLGEAELRRLFAAATNLKHKAILFVAYSAGLRVSEVINLRLQDIDREREQLFIHCSKGKKDRYVRLSPLVLDILEQYYKMAAKKPINYLFEGPHAGEPYSIRSAQQIFADAKQKAGIAKTASFHNLRHSFATHLLEKGTDVLYIKEILGHFNIKTTQRYLHIARDILINIPSPIDSLYTKK